MLVIFDDSKLAGGRSRVSIGLKKWLEIKLRIGFPRWIRKFYRAFYSFAPVAPINSLPPELLTNCRFLPSRQAMLGQIPPGGRVAELGVYRGDFSREIILINQPSELHLVDIDDSHFITQGLEINTIVRHKGLTYDVISTFPDQYFDWIYVDADHSFAGCLRDTLAAAPKIKPGGYLVFNDFAHIDPWLGRYGVCRAVVEFVNTNKWPAAYFCYHPAGLYDLALQRPSETAQ